MSLTCVFKFNLIIIKVIVITQQCQDSHTYQNYLNSITKVPLGIIVGRSPPTQCFFYSYNMAGLTMHRSYVLLTSAEDPRVPITLVKAWLLNLTWRASGKVNLKLYANKACMCHVKYPQFSRGFSFGNYRPYPMLNWNNYYLKGLVKKW